MCQELSTAIDWLLAQVRLQPYTKLSYLGSQLHTQLCYQLCTHAVAAAPSSV